MHSDDPRPVQRPDPDPTTLTTAQLLRELAALADRMTIRIDGDRNTVNARLDAMDHAQNLFDQYLQRMTTIGDREIAHLREVHEEKFASIGKQFIERDTRVEQTARDTKVAVDAALQAAEKAVGKQNESFALSINKSEAATTKQIDQQAMNLQTTATGLDGKIDDVKERLTRLEGEALGVLTADAKQSSKMSTNQTSTGLIIGVIGAVVAVVSVLIAVFTALTHLTPAVVR